MSQEVNPSKIYLIFKEALDNPSEGNTRITKELYAEYQDGKIIHEHGVEPVRFPVGYVLVHDKPVIHQHYDDGFETTNNIVGRPISDGVSLSHLEGELLTIIDSAIADKTQRESLKSLIRKTIWTYQSHQEQKLEAMYRSTVAPYNI